MTERRWSLNESIQEKDVIDFDAEVSSLGGLNFHCFCFLDTTNERHSHVTYCIVLFSNQGLPQGRGGIIHFVQ